MATSIRGANTINTLHLTKTTATGATQCWNVKVNGNSVEYTWGQKNGKLQTKTDTYMEGKQKRSLCQQAEFEALSIARKKLRTGYSLVSADGSLWNTLDVVHSNKDGNSGDGTQSNEQLTDLVVVNKPTINDMLLPMLAQEFGKHKQKVESAFENNISVFIQAKLDGERGLVPVGTAVLQTRTKKIIELPHIVESVKKLDSPMSLDGELYRKGVDFQTLMSLIKPTKNFKQDSEQVQFHVFDVVHQEWPFSKRHEWLKQFLSETNKDDTIQLVPTFQVFSMADIDKYHKQFVSDGFEGSIIRIDALVKTKKKEKQPIIANIGYELNKRSMVLLKRKDFFQEEYKVIGFKPKEHDDTTLGSVQVFCEKTKQEFFATPKMTHEMKKHIWDNQSEYLTKVASLRFPGWTNSGLPKHAVIVGFRDVL